MDLFIFRLLIFRNTTDFLNINLVRCNIANLIINSTILIDYLGFSVNKTIQMTFASFSYFFALSKTPSGVRIKVVRVDIFFFEINLQIKCLIFYY